LKPNGIRIRGPQPKTRGTTNKEKERPGTSAEPIQKAPPRPDMVFFLYFQALLSKRSSKTPKKLVGKKPMPKMFYKKVRTNPCRFFRNCLYCVFGSFSVWRVQKHQKIIVEKNTNNLNKQKTPT
jgi:hypothetical protein